MIKYHRDLVQQTDEWRAARCGLLTASEMKLVITPTLKVAANDKSRTHVWELVAQRIEKYVEPTFESYDMARGKQDEIDALNLYNEHYAPLERCGFVTSDEFGFTLGYSPDGLAGDVGLTEAKSRCQKYQYETIISYFPDNRIPEEYMLQIQTALLVTRRAWCDFISFGNGNPMCVIRVMPDPSIQDAIIKAATAVEADIKSKIERFHEIMATHKLIKTVRKNRSEEIKI